MGNIWNGKEGWEKNKILGAGIFSQTERKRNTQ